MLVQGHVRCMSHVPHCNVHTKTTRREVLPEEKFQLVLDLANFKPSEHSIIIDTTDDSHCVVKINV